MIKFRIYTALFICLTFVSSIAYSSRIQPINFQQLAERSSHIALGSVVSTKDIVNSKNNSIQEATIKIEHLIKGQTSEKIVKIKLRYKGLRDFDPELTKGQSGVFFLTNKDESWHLAFWGSVALFSKDNFNKK